MRLSPLLGHGRLATQEVEERREAQGLVQGIGVAEPLREREGGLAPLPRLVRIPQQPEGHGAQVAAGDARVLAVADGVVAHLTATTPTTKPIRQAQLPPPNQAIPQRPMGHHEQFGVLQPLGHAEEFLPYLARPLQLPPQHMQIEQPPQRREELLRVPHLLAEFVCPRIDAFHFWGHKALSVHQRWAQGALHD